MNYNCINYGGGTQSTALIIAALEGLVTPRPDFGLFSNTGGEPDFIIAYVEMFTKWVKERYDFDIFTVSNGNILDNLNNGYRISKKTGKKYVSATPPFFVSQPNGDLIPIRRACTSEYKIIPLERFIKKYYNIKNKNKVEHPITQWIGISYDERQREKISMEKWRTFRYPLIELKWNRIQSINYVLSFGLPQPMRSSCFFCPFHSFDYWKKLKNFHLEIFDNAVRLEKHIQSELAGRGYFNGTPYLNQWGVPLDSIDFNSQQSIVFDDLADECYGMCGT